MCGYAFVRNCYSCLKKDLTSRKSLAANYGTKSIILLIFTWRITFGFPSLHSTILPPPEGCRIYRYVDSYVRWRMLRTQNFMQRNRFFTLRPVLYVRCNLKLTWCNIMWNFLTSMHNQFENTQINLETANVRSFWIILELEFSKLK